MSTSIDRTMAAIRRAVCLAMGGAVMLATPACEGAELRGDQGNSTSSAAAPSSNPGDCPSAAAALRTQQDVTATREALANARRAGERNREALAMLREDRRWSEEGQHEGLKTAVADTIGMIEQYDREADCLEEALEND